MSLKTFMIFFPLGKIKVDVSQNVDTAYFHIMKVHGDQGMSNLSNTQSCSFKSWPFFHMASKDLISALELLWIWNTFMGKNIYNNNNNSDSSWSPFTFIDWKTAASMCL